MKRFREFYKNAPIFTKFAVFIPAVTIFFWIVSSVIGIQHIRSRLNNDFIEFNKRTIKTLVSQTANDLRYSDFTQVKRVLRDFYDPAYMSYLAVYNIELQTVATYPIRFMPKDLEFMESQIASHKEPEFITDFFKKDGKKQFHFQAHINDEYGKLIGYVAMGGNTDYLTAIARGQLLYFVVLGCIVLGIEIVAILYLTKLFTRPFKQIAKTLKAAQEKEPAELIPAVLSQPPMDTSCVEAAQVDSVLRKFLKTIQEHQEEVKKLAIQAGIGSVASHIAHDLRNPLSTLMRFLIRAKEELKNNPEMAEFVDVAKGCADRINFIADDLLDYKKAREVSPARTAVISLIKNVIKEIEPRLNEKKVQVVTSQPPLLFAMIDHKKMYRVIMNLISNAIEAISHGNGIIGIKAVAEGNNLAITVTDNGCGISAENAEKIFDSTFTFGKPNGTGLGLSYCKNVIEAHKGTLTVESEENKGSAFIINIPDVITKLPDDMEAELKTEIAANSNGNSNKHWLIIEDDPGCLHEWRDIFKCNKLPKPVEVTAPEFIMGSKLDLAGFYGAIVDHDFITSETKGPEVIKYLKEKGVDNIYFCSFHDESYVIRDEIFRAGAVGAIPKPIPNDIDKVLLGAKDKPAYLTRVISPPPF